MNTVAGNKAADKNPVGSVKSGIYGSNHGVKYLKIENEHLNNIFVGTSQSIFLNIVITINILLI